MENGGAPNSAQSNQRRPDLRWYQVGLCVCLLLTAVIAVLLWVVSTLGLVHAAIVLLALIVLFCTMRWRPQVRLTTAVVLALVTGILVWANLRPTRRYIEFGLATPTELDPLTAAMFWRGWPISPSSVCLIHGMRFHPSGVEQCALIFDGVLFAAVLFAVRTASERFLRWDGECRWTRADAQCRCGAANENAIK